MRFTWMLLGAMALAETSAASEPCTVSVHLSHPAAAPPGALFQAKVTARDMFAHIGVTLQWQGGRGRDQARECWPPIEISLEAGSPGPDRPDSMAYTMPYLDGGARIYVFVERVASMVSANRMGTLLGHVLAHEITHALQRINRHSDQGVMKTRWDASDFRAMEFHPLPFAVTDVLLIQAAAKRPQAGAGSDPLAGPDD
jgi:hypothetical protein